jgi:hypothetical protein
MYADWLVSDHGSVAISSNDLPCCSLYVLICILRMIFPVLQHNFWSLHKLMKDSLLDSVLSKYYVLQEDICSRFKVKNKLLSIISHSWNILSEWVSVCVCVCLYMCISVYLSVFLFRVKGRDWENNSIHSWWWMFGDHVSQATVMTLGELLRVNWHVQHQTSSNGWKKHKVWRLNWLSIWVIPYITQLLGMAS